MKIKKFLPYLMLTFCIMLSASLFQGKVQAADSPEAPVQLQWYVLGEEPGRYAEVIDKANTYLLDKLNVTIDFHFMGWNDIFEKNKLLSAAGEKIDLIYTADWLNYSRDAANGLFYPINDLIDKYAPKTKAILGTSILNGSKVQGQIFALPLPGQAGGKASGISFRKDLLQKYKMDVSKIKKLEDVEPLLKQIKSKVPSMIPLLNLDNSLYPDLLGFDEMDSTLFCPGSVKQNGKNYTVANEFSSPEAMSFFKVLNRFQKLGYLKYGYNYASEISAGKVFAVMSSNLRPTSAPLLGHESVNINLATPLITTSSARSCMTAVGYRSEYPEKALQVQELINTDSYLNNLLHFGIEDEDYTKVADHVIKYLDSYSGYESYQGSSLLWNLGNNYLDYTFENQSPNVQNDLKAFNRRALAAKTLGFTFDPSAVSQQVSACNAVWQKYVPDLLSGKGDPVKTIPIMNNAFKKAGMDKVIAEKQKQLNAWLSSSPSPSAKAKPSWVTVSMGGETLSFNHPAVVESGSVLVPMKSIFDSMDAYAEYNPGTKTITAARGATSLKMTIGKSVGYVNGATVQLSAAPRIIDDLAYVPLDFISKSLGYSYTWNGDKKTAAITQGSAQTATGNHWGNIANNGYTAVQGDWIYYSLYQDGFYKMRRDGSGKTKLSDLDVSFINLSGDWIYYVNSNDGSSPEKQRLYRMKTDGTGKTKLTSSQVSFANLSGEWIYYINTSDNNRIYKISLAGKQNQKVGNDSAKMMYAENGWIYYQKQGEQKLYKMRSSGTNLQLIASDLSKYNSEVNKVGDYIYYSANGSDAAGIFRINTSGKDKKRVFGATPVSMNCVGSNIYFVDYNDQLYKINESSQTKTKICGSIGGDINYADDWIYYSASDKEDYNEDSDLDYRIKTDGSVKQKITHSGDLKELYRVSESDRIPVAKPIILPASTPPNTVLSAKEIAKLKNAVVHIKVYDDNGIELASGSGFNIDSTGKVVTNYHVIKEAFSIKCIFDNNAVYDVDYVLNFNALKDIAILQLKNAASLPVVILGDSDKAELADSVWAIGNPMQLQNTISDGIVSGIRTMFGIKYIQTTASISPGSSGGPLFNSYGEVIGITSMSMMGTQNINFAIPINTVKSMFSSARSFAIYNAVDYESNISEFERNDTVSSANSFDIDQYIEGNIADDKDVDYYKFTLSEDKKVSFYGTFNTYDKNVNAAKSFHLTLLDQNGAEISKGTVTTEEGIDIVCISADLKAGTYCLKVSKEKIGASSTDLDDYEVLSIAN